MTMKLRLTTLGENKKCHEGHLHVIDENGLISRRLPKPYHTIDYILAHWSSFIELILATEDKKPNIRNALCYLAALPRTCQILYGSAYGNRSKRVFQKNDSCNDNLLEDILIYQGSSDYFLPTDVNFELATDLDWELDFEPELFVVVDDVPMGTLPCNILPLIKFIGACNDFTYRALIRKERLSGFGFIASKPFSSMAPFIVTPAYLEKNWNDGCPDLHMEVTLNEKTIASHSTKEMKFDFSELVSYAAKTRDLSRGTIVTSGTVSTASKDSFGSIVELRSHQGELGLPLTPFLKSGDCVSVDFRDKEGKSLFGSLNNEINLAT